MLEAESVRQVLTINPKNKLLMQKYLDMVVKEKAFNEGYGLFVLKYVNHYMVTNAIHKKYDSFDLEYILKPYLVDRLLLKAKNYNKDISEALTFITRICDNALVDGIRKIKKTKGRDSAEIFYTDEMYKFDFQEDTKEEMSLIEAPEVMINNLKKKSNGGKKSKGKSKV